MILFKDHHMQTLVYCIATTMEKVHRDIIRRNLVLLSKELDVVLILPYLYQEKIFNDLDIENIVYKDIRGERFDYFIKTLRRCGPRAYNVFINAVAEVQNHLLDLMDI